MIKMTQRWALIQDGFVIEITEIDPEGRFHPDFIWVEIPEEVVAEVGYAYAAGQFTAPVVVVDPEQILRTRDDLLAQAAIRIAPLQDAADIGIATPEEEASLLLWKRYRVDLNRIQLQPGFPDTFTWPQPPEE